VNEPLIILDHTPTPVRAFKWDKFLITHRMPALNIHRIAANEEERREWLRRQKRWTRKMYLRHLAGRLLRGELGSFLQGLGIGRDVFTRLHQRPYRISERGPVRFLPDPTL
jgi:hypothetical protein